MRNQTLQPRGFLVVIATVALSLAAAGIPSALYPTYRHEYGLSPLAQTALFATYAIALFPALLAGGKLLQRVSGTTVIMAGVVLVVLADLLFAHDATVGELFTARAVQGVGIGLINAAAGVLALTTRSDASPAKAALGTALATAIGLGIGVLGSGVWLRTGPHPTLWPYAIHAMATVGALIAIRSLVRPADPPTLPKPAEAPAPTRAKAAALFLLTCAAVFLAWGYGGLLLAVLPDLTTHISPAATTATGPALLAAMFLSVATSEWFTSRSLAPSRGLVIGLVVLGIGGAALVLAATLASIPLLATAGVLLGVGLGAAFVSAIASANDLIPAHRRNVLLPRFYACVFAGNAIPALATGYLAGHLSLTTSTAVVSATLAVACAAVCCGQAWGNSRRRGDDKRQLTVRSKPPQHGSPAPGLTRSLTALMAVATGICVANNYYAQPLLDEIGSTFGVSGGQAAVVVTVGQIGYAAGLLFLLPLGDRLRRRPLIVTMCLVAAAGSIVSALSAGLTTLALGVVVTGIASVVAQILVPLASVLASEEERGRAVGTVMSGLLLGILLARTVSGYLSELGGWRTVYWFAAAIMGVVALALRVGLPNLPPATQASYGHLLKSTIQLVRNHRVLRVRMTYGLISYTSFSLLWTALTLLLSGKPYDYSGSTIGLFGLVGAAGALGARLAGRGADRGLAGTITGASIGLLGLSWAVLLFGPRWLGAIIIGVVLLDLGAQLLHITNQHQIYQLDATARSRLTSAYMAAYFTGGSLGSIIASLLYEAWGWTGVSAAGLIDAAVLATAWILLDTLSPRGAR